MSLFWIGLIIGACITAAVAAVAAAAGYRRMTRLQQRAKQAERLAELGTLTGGLAHEIKNPLSTVQLNLQLLQEDLPDSPRLVNRVNVCERETARLREILDDFLRYAGRIELSRTPVPLNRLCEELVDFFLPQAQFQRVQLRFKRAEPDVLVMADERLLKQAVLNLMLNGVQAMPNGGELILSISNHDREARIDVIDTGTGIPQEALGRIFDAYYSTKKSGTGLGLAMTRRIAEEHGGRVSVTSEEGKGSDFTLHLPLN
jgi:signal transduction histidine kinase